MSSENKDYHPANEGNTAPQREDPIPVERGDDEIERREAAATPMPIVGYAPANSALGAYPLSATSPQMTTGGSFAGGTSLLGLGVPFGGSNDSDGTLAQDAETALAEEPRLAAHVIEGIRIDIAFGVVELSGHVPTEADRRIAGEVVAHLSGVSAVENKLRTDPTQ
ncbi:MAG: BON domain-containing protein [Cytophagales bacterium]|nr:BON domain-containing protein [Armatimonadota bacterium]